MMRVVSIYAQEWLGPIARFKCDSPNMSISSRGPKPLSNILGELFALRGYNRRCARQRLEDIWNMTVGEPYCSQTRLGEVRHGVLNVIVAHSAILEELTAFQKPVILAALRASGTATAIRDIRFRVGTVGPQV
jgi:Dna[CI] antecedent, DciA